MMRPYQVRRAVICGGRALARTSATLALAGLCGCGAGVVNGPGANGSPLLDAAPGESAFVQYLQAAHQSTLSATSSSGSQYTISLDAQPNATATLFRGAAPAYFIVDTLTLQLQGVFGGTLSSTVATNYYLLDPYIPLGKTFGSGHPYGVVTSSTPLPTTFKVGTTGPVYSLTYYHDDTMAVMDGTETASYAVYAADSQTLRMCLSFVLSDVTLVGGSDGLVPGPEETDCYSVDALGAMSLVSIAILVATDETLTFT